MFSKDARCIYGNNQLADVICQLRFPEILSIGANLPVDFQESIRSDYPKFSVNTEPAPPRAPGSQLSDQNASVNYQFTSIDGVWQVNLTSRFIALACKKYTCWEDFAKRLDMPLAAFIKLYKPACFERVGLRYMNFFSRVALDLTDYPFRELIEAPYLGLLADDDVREQTSTRNSLDADIGINGGCRVKLHAGPGRVKRNGVDDGEVKFIFDQDLYMSGNIPVNYSAGALETLHSQAYPIFRGAITQLLHNALGPETP